MNVNEHELIIALTQIGVPHPQYGIVTAAKDAGYSVDPQNALARLNLGVTLSHNGSTLVDLSTGRGAVEAARVALENVTRQDAYSLHAKTAIIQGFGTVGGSAAKYFHEKGWKVTAISDEEGMICCADGLGIPHLLKHRVDGIVNRSDVPNDYELDDRDALLKLDADVFVPAADSNLITEQNAETIEASIIVEGANTPTTPAADKILFEKGIILVPDFVANTGAACLFHQCMFSDVPLVAETLLDNIAILTEKQVRVLLKEHEAYRGVNIRLYAEAKAVRQINAKYNR